MLSALFAGEGISPNMKGEDWIKSSQRGGHIVGICGQNTDFKPLRCKRVCTVIVCVYVLNHCIFAVTM